MDCSLSQLLMSFRQRDLLADDAAALQAHLAACPTCAERVSREATDQARLQQAMQAVHVPRGLHASLLARAAEVRLAGWRKFGTTVSLAALFLSGIVLTTVAIGWWTKPALNLEAIGMDYDHQRDLSPAMVSEWLNDRNLPATLPWDFEERLISFKGTGTIQARQVPVILYQAERETAQLYIIKESLFKLDPNQLQETTSSWAKLELRRSHGYVYVLITSTEDLTVFQKRRPLG